MVTSVEDWDPLIQLDGGAIEVPVAPESLLVIDDRVFDAEVLRAAIVFYNLTFAGPSSVPTRSVNGKVVQKAFGWIPGVIAARARAAEIDVSNFTWRPPTAVDISDCKTAVLTLIGGLRKALKSGQMSLELSDRQVTRDKWIDEVLASLPVYSRFAVRGGRIAQSSVPMLRGLRECVAYAIVVVELDKWQPRLSERIHTCPYRSGEYHTSHVFLDFRVSESGELKKNKQGFCCAAHGNRFKQRAHRERQRQRPVAHSITRSTWNAIARRQVWYRDLLEKWMAEWPKRRIKARSLAERVDRHAERMNRLLLYGFHHFQKEVPISRAEIVRPKVRRLKK